MEVAIELLGYSGLGVRSVDPVGDFLDWLVGWLVGWLVFKMGMEWMENKKTFIYSVNDSFCMVVTM